MLQIEKLWPDKTLIQNQQTISVNKVKPIYLALINCPKVNVALKIKIFCTLRLH